MTYKERRSAEAQELRQRVYEKFGGRCAYCGCDCEYHSFHIDHITPKRRYKHNYKDHLPKGSDEESNLFPSCSSCNCVKSDMCIESFRDQIRSRLHVLNNSKSFTEYRLVKRYGLVFELDNPVVFYFETIQD